MSIAQRITRLEKAVAVPCTLCGGRGKLVIRVREDTTPITGCDRCDRVHVVYYPFSPPGVKSISTYVYQQELAERRCSQTTRICRPSSGDGKGKSRGRGKAKSQGSSVD